MRHVVAAVVFLLIQHPFLTIVGSTEEVDFTSDNLFLVSCVYENFYWQHVAIFNWKHRPNYMNLLLLFCGDIHLNPGPVFFRCTVCSHPAYSNQHGIQCDQCQNWTHAGCSDVSKGMYDQLGSHLELSWYCPSCLFLKLPTVSDGELL